MSKTVKQNPKEIVNIITLVDEFIATLNQRCNIHKVGKVYDVRIIDATTQPTQEQMKAGAKPQRCKRIMFTVATVETGERTTLFTLDYVITAKQILTAPWKRVLYREFLFNAVGTFGMNLETAIKTRQVDKKLGDVNTFGVSAEYPVSPEEAIAPEIK